MTLQDKLDALKADFVSQASPEVVEIMHRATESLRNSGIMERIPKVGDRMPEFELPNADGIVYRSGELIGRGPLVVNFFRGHW